jgi:hypothetical protein
MKLYLLLAASPVLACLRTYANIVHDPLLTGGNTVWGVAAIDNGITTCTSDLGATLDGNGNLSIGCLSGYSYTFTQDGGTVWYSTPWGSNAWTQAVEQDKYCCHGACDDEHGVGISCTDYHFDTMNFC